MIKIILLLLLSCSLHAQSVMDSFSEEEEMSSEVSSLISERVEKISPNRKIFIISNENQSFTQGDFISLLTKGKLVSRALVAKTQDSIAGIKILKIYNLSLWKKIGKGREIQIIRGDDSYYQRAEKRKKKIEAGDGLVENDLYDKTIISEDLLEDVSDETIFRTDSMISITYGFFQGLDALGQSKYYGQLNLQYYYQAFKNFMVGIDFGYSTVKDFPSGGLDTSYYNIVPKVKYTFEVFWGLIIQPYLGWQWLIANSPGAGQADGQTSQDQLSFETQLVNESEKSTFAAGITLVQPIVPGWNLKADLGMDILSIGVGLEI